VRAPSRGIIQSAAGFYHWGNGNKWGCLKLLEQGIPCQTLRALLPGLNVTALVALAQAVLFWSGDAAPGMPLPPEKTPRITLVY
jgi:uncharacterized protein